MPPNGHRRRATWRTTIGLSAARHRERRRPDASRGPTTRVTAVSRGSAPSRSFRRTSPDYGDRHREPTAGLRRRAAGARRRLRRPAQHGEPGRDRMAVHVVWEVVLLLRRRRVGVPALPRRTPTRCAATASRRCCSSRPPRSACSPSAPGLTLRAGAPNLALGPIAVAAALYFAENGDRGRWSRAGVGRARRGGRRRRRAGDLVVGFHVPGWAASLAAGLGADRVHPAARRGRSTVQGELRPDRPRAVPRSAGSWRWPCSAGCSALITPVRRAVGRFRPVGDPARRRGAPRRPCYAARSCCRSVFAAGAGVLLAAAAARATRRAGDRHRAAPASRSARPCSAAPARSAAAAACSAPCSPSSLLALFIQYFDARGLGHPRVRASAGRCDRRSA